MKGDAWGEFKWNNRRLKACVKCDNLSATVHKYLSAH